MIVIKQFGSMGEIDTLYRFKVDGVGTEEDDDGNVSSVLVIYTDGTNEKFDNVLSVEVL